MDRSDDMNIFQNRLHSFEVEHNVNKRRASSTKKKPASTVSWPHETPTPEQLAKAGFYYKPAAHSPDTVTCFLCNKSLDGWDADDNPALEHLSHVPDCGWAINVCIEQRSQDPNAVEEDPLNEKMSEARLATFRDWWPHDGKRGWKCSLKRMVSAGWSYNPLADADDCVTCFYCGVSLDGWEPKDDPLEEHRRRAPLCQFFALTENSKTTKRSVKVNKSRSSRASRLSRLSANSNLSMMSEEPSLEHIEDAEVGEDDTIMTAASTVSKVGKSRKKATKAKTAQKGGRKTARQKEESVQESNVEESSHSAAQPEEPSQLEAHPEPQTKPRRGGKRTTKRATSGASQITTIIGEGLPSKNSAIKSTQNRIVGSSAGGLADSVADNAILQDENPAKLRRGVKRTSDGHVKNENSAMLEEEGSDTQMDEPKPKGKGRPKRLTKQQSQLSSETAEEGAPKPKAKGKLKKPSIQSQEITGADSKSAMPLDRPITKPKKSGLVLTNALGNSDLLSQEEVVEQKSSKVAPTNSKLRHRAEANASDEARLQRDKTISAPLSKADRATLPTSSSPQSSDVENQPPSSRVSLESRPSLTAFPEPPSARKNAPISPVATDPVVAVTPSTSPSKRHINTSGITSSLPWTAIDLATTFPLSSGPDEQSTVGIELDAILQDAKPGLLTSQEKQMTVEEWILWNAARAEERMRGECERMIQRFEEEGGRAMRVLEGVNCVA